MDQDFLLAELCNTDIFTSFSSSASDIQSISCKNPYTDWTRHTSDLHTNRDNIRPQSHRTL